MTEAYQIHNNVAPPTMDTILERKTILYTRFFYETRFLRQVQCFLKFLQFQPEMFLKCFLQILVHTIS